MEMHRVRVESSIEREKAVLALDSMRKRTEQKGFRTEEEIEQLVSEARNNSGSKKDSNL